MKLISAICLHIFMVLSLAKMRVFEITDETEFNVLAALGPHAVIFFYAPWW